MRNRSMIFLKQALEALGVAAQHPLSVGLYAMSLS